MNILKNKNKKPTTKKSQRNKPPLACFPKTVRLLCWEVLSVRLLPFSFFMTLKLFVKCKQNFKELVVVTLQAK